MASNSAVLRAFSPRILQLIIFPTEQCNFRCTYCYEKFEIGQMSPSVVGGIKALIAKRHDLKQLNIMWFGGEPTAASRIVRDLSGYFSEQSQERGFKYSAHMTTNGYLLTRTMFEDFIDLKIDDYQISLDGEEQMHNSSRKLSSGGKTYEKIMRNLYAYKASSRSFHVTLRVHVSKSNYKGMDRFVRMLDEQFLIDPRFGINIHPVEPLNSDKTFNGDVLPASDAEVIVTDLNKSLRNRAHMHNIYGNSEYVCYAAQPNSFVIRADGRLAKCTVALSNPKNDIGRIDQNGDLHVKDKEHNAWLRGWGESNSAMLSCPVSFV